MTATKKTAKAKKRTPRKPLTTKQQRFVDLYDGNATEAARKAGYKGNRKTVAQVGKENLRKPTIKAAIQKREEERNKPLIADRQERQEFWTRVLKGEEGQIKLIGKGKNRKDITIKPKMSDRLKASELLGRSEADFTDKKVVDLGIKGLEAALDEAEGTGKIPIREQ